MIVLPMVMDREPRPVGPDIQIRIPSQDAGSLAAKVMPGKSSPLPAPEPKAVAEPVPESKPDPRPEPKAAESIAAASAVAAAKPVEKVLAKTADKPASAPKPAGKAPPAAKPADKPAEKAAAMPAADANGQWVVQLGAYKEAANVKLLLSKLKGVNVPAYTEKYDSPQGTRTRVRAGPFATQEAAEKARARIKIIGVDGPVAPR
ncbi:MAG: SPOR domain-containing protein [Sulfuritalea sp.]|nr:SPOR domain-containing protein [Sulfuritalea sp.]